jgi:hypothetical protein
MIYAAALIAIGVYPIQREYGSVSEFIRRQTSRFVPGTVLPKGDSLDKLRVKRPMPNGSSAQSARSRLAVPKDLNQKNNKPLDKLTQKDRGQLNSLIDGLAR